MESGVEKEWAVDDKEGILKGNTKLGKKIWVEVIVKGVERRRMRSGRKGEEGTVCWFG